MYPCGHCRASAVGPDGRCAACGSYQRPQPQPMGAPLPPMPPMPQYGYAGPGMPVGGVDLRRGVRIALTVMLSVTIVTMLGLVGALGEERSALEDVLGGNGSHADAVQRVDDAASFYSSMNVLYLLSFLATAILWVIWFRRARLNAELFAPGTQRFGSGWAVGAWVTPVVSFWFPKQMANDIYRASAPAGPQSAPKGLLNGWWVLWNAATVVSFVGTVSERIMEVKIKKAAESGVYGGPEWHDAVDAAKGAMSLSAFAMLLYIAAGVLAILVVRQLTRMQEQRAMAGPAGVPMGAGPYGSVAPMPGMPGMPVPGMPGAPGSGYPPAPPYGAPQNPFGSGPAGY